VWPAQIGFALKAIAWMLHPNRRQQALDYLGEITPDGSEGDDHHS